MVYRKKYVLKILKYIHIPNIIRAIRYALLISKAEDFQCATNYIQALEYLERANNIHPLLGEALLTRAQIKRCIKKYSESIEDAKLAIQKIKKKNYSKADNDYLIYYSCRVGALSQIAMNNIEEEFVDQEFKQVKFSDIPISQVSGHILRDFPLKTAKK